MESKPIWNDINNINDNNDSDGVGDGVIIGAVV